MLERSRLAAVEQRAKAQTGKQVPHYHIIMSNCIDDPAFGAAGRCCSMEHCARANYLDPLPHMPCTTHMRMYRL
jgi:hypothetical protein